MMYPPSEETFPAQRKTSSESTRRGIRLHHPLIFQIRMALPFLFAEFGTVTKVWLPRLRRVGPSASLDKSEYLFLLLAAVYIMRVIDMSRAWLLLVYRVPNG